MGKELLVGLGIDHVRLAPCENAEIEKPVDEHVSRRVMDRLYRHTGVNTFDGPIVRLQHQIINDSLGRRERSGYRERTGDVAHVEVHLGTGVHEDQVPVTQAAVVLHVMKHARVRARAHDRGIGGAPSPFSTKSPVEDPLELPLARPGAHGSEHLGKRLDRNGSSPPHALELVRVFREPLWIQQPPGIDDPVRPDALPGTPRPGSLESLHHQALKGRLGPNPEVHTLGFREQFGKVLGKQVVTISRIGAEYLLCPLRPESLSAPALFLGTPDPYEEYEVAVFTTGTKHGHGPRLRHSGEIEEIAVRPVSAPGSVRVGAQYQSGTVQIRQHALAPRGENVG